MSTETTAALAAGGSALAAFLLLLLVKWQTDALRDQAGLVAHDLAVRQLIDFKKDVATQPEVLIKPFPDEGANEVGIPKNMATEEFLLFARGLWVFSFVYGVID